VLGGVTTDGENTGVVVGVNDLRSDGGWLPIEGITLRSNRGDTDDITDVIDGDAGTDGERGTQDDCIGGDDVNDGILLGRFDTDGGIKLRANGETDGERIIALVAGETEYEDGVSRYDLACLLPTDTSEGWNGNP
jgi:hypothetical protein